LSEFSSVLDALVVERQFWETWIAGDDLSLEKQKAELKLHKGAGAPDQAGWLARLAIPDASGAIAPLPDTWDVADQFSLT
jgi:hypothetical protein